MTAPTRPTPSTPASNTTPSPALATVGCERYCPDATKLPHAAVSSTAAHSTAASAACQNSHSPTTSIAQITARTNGSARLPYQRTGRSPVSIAAK